MSHFTWLPFFEEMLSVICAKHNKNTLIGIFYSIFSDAGGIEDLYADGTKGPLKEIDPFTFIAYFNRNNTDDNRIAYCEKAKELFQLNSNAPQDFSGIPYINPQNSWFFGWEKNRDPKSIDMLWELSKQLNTNSIESKLFADVLHIKQIGVSKITQLLFICKPMLYLSLDNRNRTYLKQFNIDAKNICKQLDKTDGFIHYQDFLSEIIKELNKPFYVISHEAYLHRDAPEFALTSEQFDKLMRQFKELMPDFVDFTNPGQTLLVKELEYKRKALKRYQEEIGNAKIKEMLEQGHGQAALEEIANRIQTNLVSYHSWNIFGSTNDVITSILKKFVEVSEQEYNGSDTLTPIFDEATKLNVTPTWDSYSAVLWAFNPDAYAPIKITYFRDLAAELGQELPKGRPNAKKYASVIDWMNAFWIALDEAGYKPNDWVDVQSFIWCVCPKDKDGEDEQIESKDINSKAKEHSIRYWVIAPGEHARLWDEWQREHIIAIGWDQTGDLNQYNSKVEIANKLREGNEAVTKDKAAFMVYAFLKEIKQGDIVFAKKGTKKLIGYGKVISDYIYSPQRKEYQHVRKVQWLNTGEWELPDDTTVHVKTLTEITHYPEYLQRIKHLIGIENESDNSFVSCSYWWLNANPKIWNFSDIGVGEKQTYTLLSEKGNKRRIYKNFEAVKVGDFVLGYVASPDCEITTICRITQGLHKTSEGEVIEFEKVETLSNPVSLQELKSVPELEHCEPFINNLLGSLFKLTKDEYEIIRGIIDDKNIQKPEPVEIYTKSQALKDLFISEQKFDDILNALNRKKNLVLQGAPGVGKTYIAKKIAFALIGLKEEQRVQMIQFHQSYSYEDFIQGYRPTDTGKFDLKNGVFYEFCKKAQRNKDDKYVFIIDEINRGNLSKIFGELMMLIESDKRKSEYAVPLTYAKTMDETIYIPDNLYLIGTMNTADRSLAIVDYALRRRFCFIDLDPCFNSKGFNDYLQKNGVEQRIIDKINSRMTDLNQQIAQDKKNLGEGYRIGHSYFCPDGKAFGYDDDWYNNIVKHEIEPLVREYWFDDTDKAEVAINTLLK